MMLLPLWAIFGSILVSYYNGVRWSPVVGGVGGGGGGGGLVVANLHYYRHTNIPTYYCLFRIMLKLGRV
jgi:hypothetical protein